MTPAEEWQEWREKRESGAVTKQQWLTWARKYVAGLPDSPWREFCRSHIQFVARS